VSGYNKVILMGKLTRDVEMRALPSGSSVAQFGLAVNERFKGSDGQWQERANFIDCEMFGNRAEAFGKFHSKGSTAFIEGKLRLDQWQDKDGSKRSKLKVVAESFEFVGGKGDAPDEPRRGGGSRGRQAEPEIDHDSIPF
jgi:single-strand DNA-binding protein